MIGAADDVMGRVGSLLAPIFEKSSLTLSLAKRSDTFVARFSGDGLGYGAHFDGDERCRLTCILYASKWLPEHGGQIQLLDERNKCWWAVPPREDTIVFFRSDQILHKVEPCYSRRHALTTFWSVGREHMHGLH